MTVRQFEIAVSWDDEANVWIGTSKEVAGLVVQGKTLDIIEYKARLTIPALIDQEIEYGDIIQIIFLLKPLPSVAQSD